MNGEWIPLMDYAMKKGVSLSTLRRHIKSNKVLYRIENGRYLLFIESSGAVSAAPVRPAAPPIPAPVVRPATPPRQTAAPAAVPANAQSANSSSDFLVAQLQVKLKKAQEEIVELKTLIAFYEESMGLGGAAAEPTPLATNPFPEELYGVSTPRAIKRSPNSSSNA